MSTVDDNNKQLQQVLQLFLQPDFNVVSTTYLDLLLTHVTDEVKKGNQAISQSLQSWLVDAFNAWNENFKPCQSVTTFTIKLIGSMSLNQAIFFNLSQNEIHNKACTVLEFQKKDLSASVKMAFTEMCLNLLEHQSGRQWIVQTGAWREILRYSQSNHTMYVSRESRKFLSIFLLKECNDRSLCEEIIRNICKPLMDRTFPTQENNLQFILDKKALQEENNLLLSTLELLLVIIDYAVFHDLENPIPEIFEEIASLESRVKVVFEATISTPFVKYTHKLVKLITFSKLRISLRDQKISSTFDEKTFEQFCIQLCYISTILVSKKHVVELVVSKKYDIVYWKKLNKLKKIDLPNPYIFEIQVVALMIIPLCVTLKPKHMREHYLFEEYLDKLFKLTCTVVQRLAYGIRDILLKNDFPMESICKSVIDHMLEIAEIMDRETAVICFQTMCYALKNFVAESNESVMQSEKPDEPTETMNSPKNSYLKKKQAFRYFLEGDPINDKQMLLAALLNGLNVYTEKFKLKWQECVETICVLSIAQDILNHPGVDQKICTLALKTCKLAIENFMPPNLVLLVDFDEHTKQIGPTLFKRIHDTNWEVQDSVLEILDKIACLSEHKYPPYQSLLLENKFLQVSLEIAKSDNESYVKASALTFISTAVRIDALWEKILCQLNLPDLAIKLVYTESEAVVRREAVVLIKELYKYRKWPKSMISAMSQAMTTAAVLDLHWEVKINALEFWRYFIKAHLTDQGMLDGYFPNVTFSKEHRKIVSLDESEIKQRLGKALDELSRQRCLGVLLVTLKDESDLEVAKTSANIITELRRILLNYKINEPTPEPLLPKDSAIIDTNYVKRPSVKNSIDMKKADDAIIESIVDANDANLLASIYRESMRMDGDETDRTRKETLEYIGKVSRQEFLRKILNFDLDGYIKQRSDWIQNYTTSFQSVLDDIIMISQKENINTMDCY